MIQLDLAVKLAMACQTICMAQVGGARGVRKETRGGENACR